MRRSHRSRSGSTRAPRAYGVRSWSRSCHSTKSHRSSSLTSSSGAERALGGSRACGPRVHGSRTRRSLAGAPGGMVPIAHALSVAATGLDDTVGPVRALVLVVGIMALAHISGSCLDLI